MGGPTLAMYFPGKQAAHCSSWCDPAGAYLGKKKELEKKKFSIEYVD